MEEFHTIPPISTDEEKEVRPTRFFFMSIKRKIILSALIIAILLFSRMLTAPVDFPSDGIVTVESGQSVIGLGRLLQDEGYIRSPVAFVTLVTFFGSERTLSTGDYFFDAPQSVIHLAQQIARGDHNIEQIKVTIPEGENVQEIAELLSRKLPQVLSADFIQQAQPLEGYLFPETYFFYPKTTVAGVIADMQDMFVYQTKSVLTPDALSGRTQNEILTMASLIEREAHGEDDRTVIAGILYNRLEKDMPLQVDATVAYANSIPEKSLAKKHFSIDSPYNTYLYKGLPPKPIANPGLESIRAALTPAQTPYLYYLHDSRGSIHYARTYTEHLANIKKYLR